MDTPSLYVALVHVASSFELTVRSSQPLFKGDWKQVVRTCKSTLQENDLATIEHYKSWERARNFITRSPSYSIRKTRASIAHFRPFVDYFEQELAPGLDAAFLWGCLACLLQVCHVKTARWPC